MTALRKHGIKNPHIKHWVKQSIGGDGKGRTCYICIESCDITPLKIAATTYEITCKNCLKILKKKHLEVSQ